MAIRKKYMVVETFKPEKLRDLYIRFENEGRLLPEGVVYIDSWIDESLGTCFQLTESDSVEKVKEWAKQWDEFASFEIMPIIDSREAKSRVLNGD